MNSLKLNSPKRKLALHKKFDYLKITINAYIKDYIWGKNYAK